MMKKKKKNRASDVFSDQRGEKGMPQKQMWSFQGTREKSRDSRGDSSCRMAASSVPASSIHKSHCLECLPIRTSSLWEPVSPTHSPGLTKFDCTRLDFWRVSFNRPYLRTIKFRSLEVIMFGYEHVHPLDQLGGGEKEKGKERKRSEWQHRSWNRRLASLKV